MARFAVERQHLAIRALVLCRQPQKVLRRALDDQTALGAVLDQDRDAPSLEVEWHFVDLLPLGHIERMSRKNRLIERALHPGLELAIDIGVGIYGLTLDAPPVNGAHDYLAFPASATTCEPCWPATIRRRSRPLLCSRLVI